MIEAAAFDEREVWRLALVLSGSAARADDVLAGVARQFDSLPRAPESSVLGQIVLLSRARDDSGAAAGAFRPAPDDFPAESRPLVRALAALTPADRHAWCVVAACGRPLPEACAALRARPDELSARIDVAERTLRGHQEIAGASSPDSFQRAVAALRGIDARAALQRVEPRLRRAAMGRRRTAALKLCALAACMAVMVYVGLDLLRAGAQERSMRSAGDLIDGQTAATGAGPSPMPSGPAR